MNFKQELINLLVKQTNLSTEEIAKLLTLPPQPSMGDFAFPCFKLGGKEGAEKIKKNLHFPSFISKVETAGPYLNFFLNPTILAQTTLTEIKTKKTRYGQGKSGKKIVIEYCGPNTNKPLHLGHIRNMALGNAICRILQFQGNKIIPVNIINDRGIHICQSMLAYQKWGNHKKPDKKGDHFVGDYYVLFAKNIKENPSLKEEVQNTLLKWEAGDKQTRVLWKKMNQWVLQGFAQTYKRFGISFDKEYFESEHYLHGKEIALQGLNKKIFVKDEEQAIIVPLEQYGIPDKVILRADGTSIYITQDLYLAQKRYQDFKFDQMIYVVASEQKLHFQQLFKILELLQKEEKQEKDRFAQHLYHLSYGMVHLPTGRMKSREGTVIDADDLMDEMATLAKQEILKRHPHLAEKKNQAELKQRSEMISLGAIKFFMLKTDANRDMIFNPEESLSFEGETGPYIQYAYARAHSILSKAKIKRLKVDYSKLNGSLEQEILILLTAFPDKINETAQQYKPHILTQYLISLAQKFNEFYHACPVISEEQELMKARLALVEAVAQILQQGLNLLGIETPKEM